MPGYSRSMDIYCTIVLKAFIFNGAEAWKNLDAEYLRKVP
jgi:hypothetical protein